MKQMIQRIFTLITALSIMFSAVAIPYNANNSAEAGTEIVIPLNDSPEDPGNRN